MVYLKISIGNKTHEDTTFTPKHGRNSVVNMQYSYAMLFHFMYIRRLWPILGGSKF